MNIFIRRTSSEENGEGRGDKVKSSQVKSSHAPTCAPGLSHRGGGKALLARQEEQRAGASSHHTSLLGGPWAAGAVT